MPINQTITEATGAFMCGHNEEAVEKLRQHSLPIAFSMASIDFIILLEANGEFRTYGPPGGNNAIYHAIEWAYNNQAAWGVQIDRFGDKTYPVLLLSSHRGAKELIAYMNETFKSNA